MDWHCVTGWTKLDLGPFFGVGMSRLLEELQPNGDWDCLYQECIRNHYSAVCARVTLLCPRA